MNTNPPKISIIIPAFNSAEYISDAIASATAQSYPAYEIIVVDDGSTDNTEQVLSSYSRDQIIRYFKQLNQGPSAARNFGVDQAAGDLICFLDADDLLLPQCLHQAAGFFQSTNQPAVFFPNFYKQDITAPSIPSSDRGHWEEGNIWQTISEHGDIKDSSLADILFLKQGYFVLLLTNFPQLSGTVVPRILFHEVDGFQTNMNMGEDRDLFLRLGLNAAIAVCKKPLAVYRRRPGSLVERPEQYMLSRIKTPEKHLCEDRLSTSQLGIFKKAQREYYLDYAWHLFREKRHDEARNSMLDCRVNVGWSLKCRFLYLLTISPRPVINTLVSIKQKLSNLVANAFR